MERIKLKRKILIFTIILLILMFITIGLIILLKVEEYNEEPTEMTEEEYREFLGEDLFKKEDMEVTSMQYIAVRTCLQNYMEKINFGSSAYYGYNDNDEYTVIVTEEEISKNVYDILSKEFIQKNSIQEGEVFKYINKHDKSVLLSIVEIKKLNVNESVKSFAVEILLQNTSDLSSIGINYMIVNLDDNNLTYSLEPVNVSNIEEIKLSTKIEEIQPNENNTFKYQVLKDQDMIQEYINKYQRLSIASPKYVYDKILDKDYKESRFGSVEKFQQYITENIEKIKSISMDKYQKIEKSDYVEYVCIDQRGKYYIIRENSITDYSLILDTYSIDIPEFVEKYDSASETNKVALNSNKIVEAANNGDYEYIYNKLDETFRQNNFESVDKLEEYIKNTFYENCVIKSAQCKQEGNAYIFTMQISDYQGKSLSKEVKIIMKLLENRDFVMSFSI